MDVLSHSAAAQRTRRQPPGRAGGEGVPGVPGQPGPGGLFNPMMPPPHMWPHPGMVPPQPPAPPNPAEGANQPPVPQPTAADGQGGPDQGLTTCAHVDEHVHVCTFSTFSTDQVPQEERTEANGPQPSPQAQAAPPTAPPPFPAFIPPPFMMPPMFGMQPFGGKQSTTHTVK